MYIQTFDNYRHLNEIRHPYLTIYEHLQTEYGIVYSQPIDHKFTGYRSNMKGKKDKTNTAGINTLLATISTADALPFNLFENHFKGKSQVISWRNGGASKRACMDHNDEDNAVPLPNTGAVVLAADANVPAYCCFAPVSSRCSSRIAKITEKKNPATLNQSRECIDDFYSRCPPILFV